MEVKYEKLTEKDTERKLKLANLPFKSLLTTNKLSETRPGTMYTNTREWKEETWTHVYVETHTHTHWVQEATECRAVGVRLQEWNHPKSRLLLSLFNCWLGQLFEGPFNCHSDGILTTKRHFFTFLLIYPFMTPIKTPTLPPTQLCFSSPPFLLQDIPEHFWLRCAYQNLSRCFVSKRLMQWCLNAKKKIN